MKNCLVCYKKFKVKKSRLEISKYCSRKCKDSSLIGKPASPKALEALKLGRAWNKGKKLPSPSKETLEKRKETFLKIELNKGEKNGMWKGDKVGYSGLHYWVRSKLGTPKHCSYCEITTAKKFEWANISRSYKRDLSDWVRLCTKCHVAFDKGRINLK